jgi:hypothetical protein
MKHQCVLKLDEAAIANKGGGSVYPYSSSEFFEGGRRDGNITGIYIKRDLLGSPAPKQIGMILEWGRVL